MTDGRHIAVDSTGPSWRPLRPGETVHVLTDLMEKPDLPQKKQRIGDVVIPDATERTAGKQGSEHAAEIMPEPMERRIGEAAEKIVRELAPDIIERVIREEIEKLKRERI